MVVHVVKPMPRRLVFQLIAVLTVTLLVMGCAPSMSPPTSAPPIGTPTTSTPLTSTPPTSPPLTGTPTTNVIPTVALAAMQANEAQIALEIDNFLAALVTKDQFSGSVLVAKDGQVILSQGYNMADRDHDVPNTPQTIFRLGSVTKQFTAMAILQLQQMGKLTVQDPICQYVQGCPDAWRPITIHHLLTHTSGIPELTALPTFPDFKKRPATPAETIDQFRDLPLDFIPGDAWSYSNSGYIVLGTIVEAASGEPFCGFVEKHITQPLQMVNTGCDSNRSVTAKRAQGYSDSDTVADVIDMSIPFSAGGLISTVEDLFRWDQALYTTELLPQSLLDKLFMPMAPIPTPNGVEEAYGYGWVIGEQFNQPRTWHRGSIEGFLSEIDRYPGRHDTIIALSNREDVNLPDVTSEIARMILEEE